ncbi:hypothetical protein [Rhodococcus sp. P1Y]|uniref:hypothetical protein n=1 Tax=Rhodococcus sp. P1Y TaxID=1302308 RepID=UPI000EB0FCD7|nr:hypothetical protein [Rhodococcus sp. P1Y]AYJ47039.1 hypothetical protein D8W71_00375 [Rhodococcus sp. P1Y]
MNQHNISSRSLRVFVAGWVIDDGSFPRAAIGDIVDVTLSVDSEDEAPTACDETRSAIARPAHGCAPRTLPSGKPHWLHLVYGDGWSGTWWADRRFDGPVTVSGLFCADLENGALDTPSRTVGRVTRIHRVDKQVRRTETGWTSMSGTERLTESTGPVTQVDWWPSDNTEDGDFVPTGLLVELDLDEAPDYEPSFRAGALSAADDILWVADKREPVLRRVDTSTNPPRITEFVLPLAFELDNGMWSRRVHAFDGGCWLTSEWDIHRCTFSDDGGLTIDRYAAEGSMLTTLLGGRLYAVGNMRSGMYSDRRYGAIRKPADTHPLRVLAEDTRELSTVDDEDLLRAVRASIRRADKAFADDGSEWNITGADRVSRKLADDSSFSTVDLGPITEQGAVHSITPDPWTDPANAEEVARISFPPPSETVPGPTRKAPRAE